MALEMRGDPQFRAGLAAAPVRLLNASGFPANRLLERSGISPHLVERPGMLVPLRHGLTFLRNAASATGLAQIGLVAGNEMTLADLGPLGASAAAAPNLGLALRATIEGAAVLNTGLVLWLERRNGAAYFGQRLALYAMDGWRQALLYGLSAMMVVVRAAAGAAWRPDRVLLPAGFRWQLRELSTIFDADCVETANDAALIFPEALLALPMPVDAARGGGPFISQAERSRIAIVEGMHSGDLRLAFVADALGLSSRTLERRLFEEGTSYAQLLELVRREEAARLLAETSLPISSIARRMGYNRSENFARAFRSWTSCSPSAFRRKRSAN